MSGSTLLVDTPAPSFSASRSRLLERLRDVAGRRPCSAADVDAGQAEGGRRGAAAHLLDLEVEPSPAGIVDQVDAVAVGDRGHVDRAVVVDVVEHVADGLGGGQIDGGGGPAAVGDFDFPATKPLPPLSESRLTLWLRLRSEAEAELPPPSELVSLWRPLLSNCWAWAICKGV